MNPINRRGQKVVCVVEFDLVSTRGGKYGGPGPLLDEVYTVINFIDNTGKFIPDADDDLSLGIELLEVPSPISPPGPLGWPIIAFRPADERKTDISDLIRLTDKVDA
jgi:hypothetical protein